MNRSIVLDLTKSVATRSSKSSRTYDAKNKRAGQRSRLTSIHNVFQCSIYNENHAYSRIFQLTKGKNKYANQELITTVLAMSIRRQHVHHKSHISITKESIIHFFFESTKPPRAINLPEAPG